jgi:O-antigen/teichoic acid export membrane protein
MIDLAGNQESTIIDFAIDKPTIKKSAINSVLIQFIIKLKGIITLPIFTYLMIPREMGIFNIILVASSVVIPLFTLNLPDGSLLFFAQEKSIDKIQKMYMTVINSVSVFTIFLSLITGLYIYFFKRDLSIYVFWVALTIYANIFYKLPACFLATYQKTGILLKNGFFREISSSLFSVLLLYLGYSYKGLVIAGSMFSIIFGIFLFRVIFRDLSFSFKIDITYLKSFLKISLPLIPVFFFSWIVQSSDSFFLLYYKGEDVVGKYSIIYGLCSVILVLTFALNYFWFPVSARLWVENREKYRKVFSIVFTAFATALFITVLLFELNSRVIMKILVRKPDYQDAYFIIGIIAFAFAMQVLITFLTAPLYSNKNPKMIFLSFLSGGLLNGLLNFLFIPSAGILGAAISTAVSYFLIVKVADFSFCDKRLIYLGVAFLALWVGVAYLREHVRFYQLIISNVILLVTLGSVVYFKVLKNEEKKFITSFFKGLSIKGALEI